MQPPAQAKDLVGHKCLSIESDPEKQLEKRVQDSRRSNNLPEGRIRVGLLLLGLFTGAFLASVDITIVATALPRIAADFDAQSQMSWVATAYLLAYTAFQPIYGRFSDIFGRKQMFLFAVVLFLIGCVGCGAAPSMVALILFRVIQGFGGSGLFTVVVIMVSDMFEDVEERARYQSMVWLAFGISAVVGPLLGGAFVQHVTWRWCFYICIPFGVVCMVLVTWLFQVPFEQSNLSEKMRRVDYAGVVLVTCSVLCLLLPLSWGGTKFAWNSAPVIVMLVLFVLLACILVFVEKRIVEEDAIIPPALFLNRNVALAVGINCVMGICFMGCLFYLPLYFQAVQGTSTTSSGLRMIPNTFGIVTSTIVSSFLLKRLRDYRIFLWIGTAVMTLGVGLFMLLDADTSLGVQLVLLLVMGLGQGLIFQNCLLACQDCAGDKHIAVATTLCGFMNSIGSAVGVAICASTFNNALQKSLSKLPIETQDIVRQMDVVENMNAISNLPEGVKEQVIGAYVDSFKTVFMVLTPIIGAGFVLSLFLRKRKIVDKA